MARAAYSIRRARHQDAHGILDCLRSAFEVYRHEYTAEGFNDTVLTPETLHRRLTEMSVYVAVAEAGEIVGTIGCKVIDNQEGHIRGMATRPSWQGTGVAQQLLEVVESELRSRKCSRVSLDTTEPLKRATRFYEKNGFRASGKVGQFFGMPLFEYTKALNTKAR